MMLARVLVLALTLSCIIAPTQAQVVDCGASSVFYDVESIQAQNCGLVGSLILTNTNYTSISSALASVESVYNYIWISNNPFLQSVTFPALLQTFLPVNITSNPQLRNLSFPVFRNFIQLTITNNPLLQTVDLSGTTKGSFLWSNLSSLTTIIAPRLTNIISHYGFNDAPAWQMGTCPSLTTLSFPLLQTIDGNFTLRHMATFTNLSVPLLTEGGVWLEDLPLLPSLALPLLDHTTALDQFGRFPFFVPGGIVVTHCPSLQNVSIPNLLRLGSELLVVYPSYALWPGASNMVFQHLSNLTQVNIPSLSLLGGTLELVNLTALPNFLAWGNINDVQHVHLANMPQITNLNGIWMSSMGLHVEQMPGLSSLHGLLLEVVPLTQRLWIQNNPNMSSLVGLERMTRIFGQLGIVQNSNLSDFTSLLASTLVMSQTAVVQQCCPDYTFFQTPSIFTFSNFPCQVCTQIQAAVPAQGVSTGGTVVKLSTSGQAPASQILVRWSDTNRDTSHGGGHDIDTACPWSLSDRTYNCQAPVFPGSSTGTSRTCTLSASYDGGRTFRPLNVEYDYQAITSSLGDGWKTSEMSSSMSLMSSWASMPVAPPPYTLIRASRSTASILPGMSSSGFVDQQNDATRVQNGILAGGLGLFCVWVGVALFLRWCTKPDLQDRWSHFLAACDKLTSTEKVKSSAAFDSGFPLMLRTSNKGGFLFLSFLIVGTTLAMANLMYSVMTNVRLSREMLPVDLSIGAASSGVATGDYDLQVQWAQLGSTGCGCGNWSMSIQGFASPGVFGCDENAQNFGTCTLTWTCLACSQSLSLATVAWNHTDANALATGLAYAFSMNSYSPQIPMTEGTQLLPGAWFSGWDVPSIIPLTLTRTAYQDVHGNPALNGWEVQPTPLLPGGIQTISQFSQSTVHGIALNVQFQKSFATFQITEINNSTILEWLGYIASIYTSIWFITRVLKTMWTYKKSSRLQLGLVKMTPEQASDPKYEPPMADVNDPGQMVLDQMSTHIRQASIQMGLVTTNHSLSLRPSPPSPTTHLPMMPANETVARPTETPINSSLHKDSDCHSTRSLVARRDLQIPPGNLQIPPESPEGQIMEDV